ncbi:hypothetical protein [Borrelia miyamotoi]|uniref:Uncharacterized protein n=1 Tax=Borrelia miyamotoi TaxID=47466 RepID=A0A481YDK7_9SPIR|nr:hypothetical protein [Borrelia miyamotoi]MBW6184759.1 hypothetical protein [Pseudomonas aeruginosa]ATQ19121.1 hypothetical protein CNO11_06170 [Borrelia miyamotoi]QBK62529.1 hypothetical protein EZU67_05065 [Borrelia miyamotoi]WDS47709.1 hypothetical protein EZU72_008865 [Borrelia miyamotoi]WEG86378.1 hypothetical protein EZU67_005065 [Borrelia miyamotoi]
MSSSLKKQINVIGTIATAIVICISGFGTYAFQGFLYQFKKEMMEELRIESENRFKIEFQSLKTFLREDLKRDIEKLNLESKEMVEEFQTLLLKERFKIKVAFKEELKKCFDSFKQLGEVNVEK